jgi:hypothetical protein
MDPSGRTMPNGVDVKAVATSLRSSRHTAKQRDFLCKKVMTLLFVDNDTVNVPRALKVQWIRSVELFHDSATQSPLEQDSATRYEFRSFSGATLHGLYQNCLSALGFL